MRLHLLILTALLLNLHLAVAAAADTLPPPVRKALQQAGIPPTAVAVVAQPVDASRPALRHRGDAPMNPASLAKLLTTLAALETLGPAYRFRTEALAEAPPRDGILDGPLYLRGSGDPKLTHDRLWLLLRELRGRGLREIRGGLVIDRTAFAPENHDPAAFDGQPLRPYNVGPDALLFNFATVHLTLIPETATVRVLADPLPVDYAVDNQLKLIAGKPCNGEWREQLTATLRPDRLQLSGDFAAACGEKQWHLAGLPNATLLAGTFARLWRELGGEIASSVREGTVPESAVPLAATESPPLGELVRDINKHSNNVMARQLFLTLGRQVGEGPSRADAPPVGGSEPGLRARGANNVGAGGTAGAEAAVRAWLAKKGMNFPELVLDNGAGLSRRARISADHLAQLLAAGWASQAMPEFLASLPIAALDGTVKKKFNGNGAAGQAHLKTGSLEGVRGIAGYLRDRQGRRHLLVFMVNHPNAAQAQPAFDALIDGLWHGSPAGRHD
jgi:D-alanyl-D-alanine carboxypeptidase/D-alanyl-D-alanine-endopeptidase (penicillin-binding protein 4)